MYCSTRAVSRNKSWGGKVSLSKLEGGESLGGANAPPRLPPPLNAAPSTNCFILLTPPLVSLENSAAGGISAEDSSTRR